MPATSAVVGNEWSVGSDVSLEFSNRFQQLSLLLPILFEVQSKFQIFNNLERFVDITAVDSNDERCGWIRQLVPVSLATTNEHVLLFPQFVF